MPVKKDNSKLTDAKIAAEIGGNRTYVAEARKIHRERPDLAEKVKAGTMSKRRLSGNINRTRG